MSGAPGAEAAVQSAPEALPQRVAASEPGGGGLVATLAAGGAPAVIALQRTAGNRAVCELLGARLMRDPDPIAETLATPEATLARLQEHVGARRPYAVVYSDDAMAGRYRLNEGTGTPPPGYVTRGGTLVVNSVRVPIPPALRQQMAQHSLAATIERGHAETEPERERLRELRRARGPARELSWPEASAIAEDADATTWYADEGLYRAHHERTFGPARSAPAHGFVDSNGEFVLHTPDGMLLPASAPRFPPLGPRGAGGGGGPGAGAAGAPPEGGSPPAGGRLPGGASAAAPEPLRPPGEREATPPPEPHPQGVPQPLGRPRPGPPLPPIPVVDPNAPADPRAPTMPDPHGETVPGAPPRPGSPPPPPPRPDPHAPTIVDPHGPTAPPPHPDPHSPTIVDPHGPTAPAPRPASAAPPAPVIADAAAAGRSRSTPRAATPPPTVDFGPSARTRLLASAVGQAAAIPANLLSSYLQDHIRDSIRHTPHAPLPAQSGRAFFESVRSGAALRPIDLVRTTIAGYADTLSQNRGSMTVGIMLRSMAINRIADDGQRRLAIRDLQGDLMDDLEHLSTVSTNVTRALAQRPEIESRAHAAEALVALLESEPSIAWLLNNGMDADELSNIISSVRGFAIAHRQTLQALERLRAVVTSAEESDRRTLDLLDAAVERGRI